MPVKITADLLKALKLENATLEINSAWKAQGPTYRQQLRRYTEDAIRQHYLDSSSWLVPQNLTETFSDLTKPPQISGLTCSISHCPAAGGFVFARESKMQLGLDLEIASLVTPEIVKRMSTTREVETAPTPAHLWAAKEATFKSLLGPHQPKILSAIQITTWTNFSPHIWLFSAQIPPLSSVQLDGAIGIENDLIVGLARFSP